MGKNIKSPHILTEDEQTGQNPHRKSKSWSPNLILFITFLVLALIAGLATAGIHFLVLSTSLSLYIAVPLALIVVLVGLILAYQASQTSWKKAHLLVNSEAGSRTSCNELKEHSTPSQALSSKLPHSVFNIIVLGDEKTGKTALVERYLKGSFTETHEPTTAHPNIKVLKTNKHPKLVCLQIWEKTMPNTKIPHGIMLVYDITNRASFEEAKKGAGDLQKEHAYTGPIMLVGCKADLEDKRQVATEEAQTHAQEQGLKFAETSAKTETGVKKAFKDLVDAILTPQPIKTPIYTQSPSPSGAQ